MKLLIVLYIILSYWAAGEVIYSNKIIMHRFGMYFVQRLCYGLFLGIFLIPIAIIKIIMTK